MASETKDGGPAYPLPNWDTTQWPKDTPADFGTGMTLRDWFAGQALVGMSCWIPRSGGANLSTKQAMQARALWAYEQADEMLAHRHTEGEQ